MSEDTEQLLDKARKLEAEYHKKWRAKNREKVRLINQRYWLKKAKKELEKKGDN